MRRFDAGVFLSEVRPSDAVERGHNQQLEVGNVAIVMHLWELCTRNRCMRTHVGSTTVNPDPLEQAFVVGSIYLAPCSVPHQSQRCRDRRSRPHNT